MSADNISQFVSAETDEWATPPGFVRPLAEAVGGFDLDPASGAETSPVAAETYTEAENGLGRPWFGTVWVNPPYSDIAAWVRKVVRESHRDAVDAIVLLCKGDSSTDWWQTAAGEAKAVGAIDGRLSFGDGENSAPFASHVFVFGAPSGAVYDVLQDEGVVLTAADGGAATYQADLLTTTGRVDE
jgi:phage N-6-adenine-methyltransferase